MPPRKPLKDPVRTIAEVLPESWRDFLQSGEYVGARAWIRSDGADAQVDLAARLELIGGRRLAIDVKLADEDDGVAVVRSRPPGPALTYRERAVVSLIATGKETREIADALQISPETVRTHVRNSMSKVSAHTRAQLVARVMAGTDSDRATH